MTKNDLINLASNYMQIWNAGNEDLMDEYTAEDIIVDYTHFSEAFHGVQKCKAMLKATYAHFPDLQIYLRELIPADNKITVYWEYDGTHQYGELFGVEPTGKMVSVSGISILEVENGKVVKEKGIVDNLSLLVQLGVFG